MVECRDLRKIPLLKDFDDSDLQLLGRVVQVFEYPAHAVVLSAGEVNRGLWFIQSGRLRVYRLDPAGHEFTMRIAQPGDSCCLGMCPLFSGHICTSCAEALEPTRVYFIESMRALTLGRSSAAFARLMGLILARNYRHLIHVSINLALECSTPRLVDLLVKYAQEHGRPGAGGVELVLDINREVLASLVRATPQMIARDLTRLGQAGVLNVRRKQMIIPNLERLSGMI